MTHYNDLDERVVAWLHALMEDGLISRGHLDTTNIEDLPPQRIDAVKRVHLFAGIGGWEHALQLAGWPATEPVWTGSCPCQPWSCAGLHRGTEDPRHLWPAFRWLIAQCRPSVVFGEQVAGSLGRRWLSGVRADLEAMGYRVAAADLCAAGVGAPHRRQRLYWVADTHDTEGRRNATSNSRGRVQKTGGSCSASSWSECDSLLCGDGKTRRIEPGLSPLVDGFSGRVGLLRGYGNAIVPQVAATFVKAYMATSERFLSV